MDINKLAEHFAATPFRLAAVYRCTLDAGVKHAGLTQPFPGFLFPLSGKGGVVFDGTAYTLSQNNALHGGAKMDIVYQSMDNAKWEYLLVLYRIVGEEPSDFSLNCTHFELQTGESPRLSQLLKQLYEASTFPGGIYSFRAETLFRCVLDEMFEMTQSQRSDEAKDVFEQITAYMHEHFMEPLTAAWLSKQYHVNGNRLSYIFHKYAGMGPGDYLIAYRLNRAKEMLMNMDVPIYMVAKGIGYGDPFHFSRLFKKQFGCSPSQYREKFKNNAS